MLGWWAACLLSLPLVLVLMLSGDERREKSTAWIDTRDAFDLRMRSKNNDEILGRKT